MSAEEVNSAREVYSWVAVTDIDISVGIMNIYLERDIRSWCSPRVVAQKQRGTYSIQEY